MTKIPQHSSKTNEAYTPQLLVDPARATLRNGIELDPASCVLGQQVVNADYWFGADHPEPTMRDGLARQWGGCVFLNPPGGILDIPIFRGSSAAYWFATLFKWYNLGLVREAIFICFTMAVFKTTQAHNVQFQLPCPAPFEFPFCVPRSRVNYDKVVYMYDGKVSEPTPLDDPAKGGYVRVPTTGAPSDTAIVYLPDRDDPDAGFQRFKENFGHLGVVRE